MPYCSTTIAVELAVELCASGFRVGLLDVDLCGPSVPRMLGLFNVPVHQCSEGFAFTLVSHLIKQYIVSLSFDRWVPVYTGVLARSKLEGDGDAVREQANSANAVSADSSTRNRLGHVDRISSSGAGHSSNLARPQEEWFVIRAHL